jgi:signal transduction histidine kinase
VKQIGLIFLGILIGWILPISLHGQETSSTFEYFNVQNGMISNSVYAIEKDVKGYIWIGTSAGISRFDGKNFIHFNNGNTAGFFEDNEVRDIIHKNNTLYLVSRSSGVIELNPTLLTFKRIIYKGVSSLDFAGDTTLILFSNNELVIKTSKAKKTRLFSSKSRGVACLYKNKVYVCFLGDVPQQLNSESLSIEKQPNSAPLIMDGRFVKSNSYGLVYHSGETVFRLVSGEWELIENINKSGKSITYFAEDHKGVAMFIVNNRVPYLHINGEVVAIHFNQSRNAELRTIYSVDELTAFVGTNQGMAHLMVLPKIVSQLSDNDVFNNEYIRVRRAILENDDNSILFTGYPTVLSYKDSFHALPLSEQLSIYDVLLRKNKLIFATDGKGLWQSEVSGENLTRINVPELAGDCWLYCLHKMDTDRIIIGGQGILIIWNSSTNEVQQILQDKSFTIYTIVKHPKRPYHVLATNKGLVFFYDGKKSDNHTLVPWNVEVKDLLFDTWSNSLWLATTNGIYVLDADNYKLKRHYIQSTELTHPIVTALVQDDQRRVWASTYSGVTVFGKGIYLLNQRNGLKNIEFNYKSAIKLQNGNIIFGGLNNYEIFTPSSLKSEVFEEEFFISGYELRQENRESKFISLNHKSKINIGFYPEKEDLKIYVNNFDYNFARMYKFFYKLDNGQWIEIERDRYILITSIALGRHDLFIKMMTPYGEEACVKHIEIEGLTALYKHPYFVSALLFAMLSLLMWAYILLKRANKIEFHTKQRVAMDLHDETGTILTRLLFLTKRKMMKNDDLETISSGLNDALFSLRSFMESLTNQKASAIDLQDELIEFISKAFSSTQISYKTQFIGDYDTIISAELYRDIKLCVYELANNCIKHSKAKHFNLLFEVGREEINIQGSDDGILIDIETLKSKNKGMPNLKKRVERQNGRLVYKSNNPSGLIVLITMQRKT